jgi:hypothetical protein
MGKKTDEKQTAKQHDGKVFYEGEAIFSESDLRELISYIYSEYQYKGTQFDRLVELFNFLTLESNRYTNPDLASESKKLGAYLDTFQGFLKNNFHQGHIENGDTIYLFNTEETSSETEAFLTEFQMISMDVEKAYRSYNAVMASTLQLKNP